MRRATAWIAALLLLPLCLHACDLGTQSGENANGTAMPAIAQVMEPIPGEEAAEGNLPNPVEPFVSGFSASFSSMCDRVRRAAEDEIHMDKTLQLDSIGQTVQFYFLGLSELLYMDGEEAWTGAIFGGAPGTGVMRAQENGYAFTITLADRNRIRGTLQNNRLEAEWMRAEDVLVTPTPTLNMPEAAPETTGEAGLHDLLPGAEEEEADPVWETVYYTEKTAALWTDASAYLVTLLEEDGYSCLWLGDEQLYCITGAPALPEISASPESWAEWGFTDGLFTTYARNAEIPNTTTEEE